MLLRRVPFFKNQFCDCFHSSPIYWCREYIGKYVVPLKHENRRLLKKKRYTFRPCLPKNDHKIVRLAHVPLSSLCTVSFNAIMCELCYRMIFFLWSIILPQASNAPVMRPAARQSTTLLRRVTSRLADATRSTHGASQVRGIRVSLSARVRKVRFALLSTMILRLFIRHLPCDRCRCNQGQRCSSSEAWKAKNLGFTRIRTQQGLVRISNDFFVSILKFYSIPLYTLINVDASTDKGVTALKHE